MSKSTNQPTRFIRKPRLRTKELCIAAIEGTGEDKGKIIAFEVRSGKEHENIERYPVKKEKNGVKLAFQRAEGFATKLILKPTTT